MNYGEYQMKDWLNGIEYPHTATFAILVKQTISA